MFLIALVFAAYPIEIYDVDDSYDQAALSANLNAEVTTGVEVARPEPVGGAASTPWLCDLRPVSPRVAPPRPGPQSPLIPPRAPLLARKTRGSPLRSDAPDPDPSHSTLTI
jgi:hypothetical protein